MKVYVVTEDAKVIEGTVPDDTLIGSEYFAPFSNDLGPTVVVHSACLYTNFGEAKADADTLRAENEKAHPQGLHLTDERRGLIRAMSMRGL